jgi:hypothetical protein
MLTGWPALLSKFVPVIISWLTGLSFFKTPITYLATIFFSDSRSPAVKPLVFKDLWQLPAGRSQ